MTLTYKLDLDILPLDLSQMWVVKNLDVFVDKTWSLPFDTWQVCGFGHILDEPR